MSKSRCKQFYIVAYYVIRLSIKFVIECVREVKRVVYVILDSKITWTYDRMKRDRNV